MEISVRSLLSRALLAGALWMVAGPASLGAQSATALLARCADEPGGGRAHVGGVVTNSVSGNSLAGARVEALVAGRVVRETHSRLGGGYVLCNLDASRDYQLRVVFGSNESAPVAVEAMGFRNVDLSVAVSAPVTIMGTVIDQETAQPIEGVWVSLPGTVHSTFTNTEGKFGFLDLSPGRYVLEANQMGYAVRADSLTFLNHALGLRIPLTREAIPIDPITVTASSERSERRGTARYRGMTSAQVDSVRSGVSGFDQLIARANLPLRVRDIYHPSAPGIRIGLCVEATRRPSPDGGCQSVTVVLDDVVLNEISAPEWLLSLSAESISHFQYMSSLEASSQYGGRLSDAGVLVIHTRDGSGR